MEDMEDKEEKINIILRQTNYSYEEAVKKITECHNDPILVIKNYLGIKESSDSSLYKF
jgi:NACalpha-BTF3-like transcription factor